MANDSTLSAVGSIAAMATLMAAAPTPPNDFPEVGLGGEPELPDPYGEPLHLELDLEAEDVLPLLEWLAHWQKRSIELDVRGEPVDTWWDVAKDVSKAFDYGQLGEPANAFGEAADPEILTPALRQLMANSEIAYQTVMAPVRRFRDDTREVVAAQKAYRVDAYLAREAAWRVRWARTMLEAALEAAPAEAHP